MNKKSFIVHFPIKQEFNHGMSWVELNELSWQELNLLSWKDLIRLIHRYLVYSIRFARKLAIQETVVSKQTFSIAFIKKRSNEILFSLKKVFQVR